MNEPMKTERATDVSKKRQAEEDSSPRERKKSRKNKDHATPVTIPVDEPKTSRKPKKTKAPVAVTPEPTKENEVSPKPTDDKGCIPTPPSTSEKTKVTAAAKKSPNESGTSKNKSIPAAKARPTVKFATATENPSNNVTTTPESQLLPPFTTDIITQYILTASSPVQSSQKFPSLFHILLFVVIGCCTAAAGAAFLPRTTSIRTFQHIIPPKHAIDAKAADMSVNLESFVSNVTLREFLTDSQGFHLAMAPSFFGFFGYFGLLAAWDEGLAFAATSSDDENQSSSTTSSFLETNTIKSAAGASAGAMAAVLLAVGVPPAKAAEFCATIDLPAFADPVGIGSIFKGDKFEQLMFDFMKENLPDNHTLRMEDANFPVAVTGFDLQTLSTLVITEGSAARSSRASATFPFLFQPVHWFDSNEQGKDYVLIDGGVMDGDGLIGLSSIEPDQLNKRIVNVVVGNFGGTGTGVPPGPSELPDGVHAKELLSISVRNLPRSGPWALENGPRAVEAAKAAMMASLDLPLYLGKEDGHYELHIDASSFAPAV